MQRIDFKNESLSDTVLNVIDSKVQYLNLKLRSSIDFYQNMEKKSSDVGQRIISHSFPFDMYERTTHEINLLLTLRRLTNESNCLVVSSLLAQNQYLEFEDSKSLKAFLEGSELN